MSTSRRSAVWQGILAGSITAAVTVVPTVAIVFGAQAGSIGSVSVSGLWIVAVALLGGIATVVGVLVGRAYRIDSQRRPGEVWTTWFSGFTALVIGSWFVPFLVLFVFVDSDHALADRMLAVLVVWSLGHLVAAGFAAWLMRGLYR